MEKAKKSPDEIEVVRRFVKNFESNIERIKKSRKVISEMPVPVGDKTQQQTLKGLDKMLAEYPQMADGVIVRTLNPDEITLEDKIKIGDPRTAFVHYTKEGAYIEGKKTTIKKDIDLKISNISIEEEQDFLKIMIRYENLGKKREIQFHTFPNCSKDGLINTISQGLYQAHNPNNKLALRLADATWKKIKKRNLNTKKV